MLRYTHSSGLTAVSCTLSHYVLFVCVLSIGSFLIRFLFSIFQYIPAPAATTPGRASDMPSRFIGVESAAVEVTTFDEKDSSTRAIAAGMP